MTRLLLVLACVAAIALCFTGMWLGWVHRAERQGDVAELPKVPTELGEPELAPLTGTYVGTTYARRWQDRVVVHDLGLRAEASAVLHRAGVVLRRQGASTLFLPAGAIRGARLEPALAGKVVGEGGLLVINWQWGQTELDTGLRADDKQAYPSWVRAINERAMV